MLMESIVGAEVCLSVVVYLSAMARVEWRVEGVEGGVVSNQTCFV